MIKFVIPLAVFHQNLTVIFGKYKDVTRYIPSSILTEKYFDEHYGLLAWGKHYTIVFNENKTNVDRMPSTIAHEVVHAASKILRDTLGHTEVTLTEDTEEVYACMVGFLVEEITKKIGDFKLKKTKKRRRKVNDKV